MNKKYFFQPSDKSNFKPMLKAELLIHSYNKTPLWNFPKRNWIIRHLLGSIDGKPYSCMSPFYVQYGKNIHIGKNFFSNYNCVIMDHAEVHIGDNVMIAPNVVITTAAHPIVAEERMVREFSNSFTPNHLGGVETVSPIKIGNNVWLATGVIVCPGVTIGDNSVIAAGSVVTRDIPPNVFACGTPCKTIHKITDEDRCYWENKCNFKPIKIE